MSKPIGIVAVGQGAQSIAVEFVKRGYFAVAMNLSERDLDATREVIPDTLLLTGEGGAGKDRAVGINAFAENGSQIVNFLGAHFRGRQDLRALFVVQTGGGGTGSGAGPAVTELAAQYLRDLIVCPVMVLPFDDEAPLSQSNTIEAFEHISRIEGVGATFVIDNASAAKLYGSRNKTELFGLINGKFAETIDTVLGLTEKVSSIVNFDIKEFFDLLSTPGQISVFDGQVIPEEPIPTAFNRLTANPNIFAPTGFSPMKAAVVFEGSAFLANSFNAAQLFTKQPIVLHEGIYNATQTHLTIVAAGLPFPDATLRHIEGKAIAPKDRFSGPVAFKANNESLSAALGMGRKQVAAATESPADMVARILQGIKK